MADAPYTPEDLLGGDLDIDTPDYADPDIDSVEIEEFTREAVKPTIAQVRQRVAARYAGQLNAIDLAKAVRDELGPLTSAAERGKLFDAAMTKLALDILAENVKPKSVREATQAIEVLHRIQGGILGGETGSVPPARRMEIFALVAQQIERTTGDQDKLPPLTREALEATVLAED